MHFQPAYRMTRREYVATVDYINPTSRESRKGRSSLVPFEGTILENMKLNGLGGRKFSTESVRLRDAKGMFSRVYIAPLGVSAAEEALAQRPTVVSDNN